MPLVIHPHLHYRRTGTTSHVEAIVRQLGPAVEARALGWALRPEIPRIGVAELWRRLRREPVVWHAHRNNELMLGLLLRWFWPGVKVIFTRHAATRPGRWTRWLYRRADELVALTPQVAQVVRHPSTVIGHGVDLERFRPPADRSQAWQALGLGGIYGVGVLGRVRPEKGQGDFVRAVTPLLAQLPQWRAVVVGRVRPRHARWVQQLEREAPATMSFRPEQAEVLGWYQGLTLFVQPSHSEGFSLVLLEAMASGCCVVASRLPHFPGIVREGETGFLYPPGDVRALGAILGELMRDPWRAQEVGRRAAQDARERLGLGAEAGALARLYARPRDAA